MDNICDGYLYIDDEYDDKTVSEMSDSLSTGLITKILTGLRDQCALESIYLHHYCNKILDQILDYVKNPISASLKKVKVWLSHSADDYDKIISILQSVQLTSLTIIGKIKLFENNTIHDTIRIIPCVKHNVRLEKLSLLKLKVERDLVDCLSSKNLRTPS